MEVENGVDARNLKAVPKTGSGNRIPIFGKFPEQQQSSGFGQNWKIPVFSGKGCTFRGHRNHMRYEDYGDKNWPRGPSIDYSDRWVQNEMYSKPQASTEVRALPQDSKLRENHVPRNPPGIATWPNASRGKTGHCNR